MSEPEANQQHASQRAPVDELVQYLQAQVDRQQAQIAALSVGFKRERLRWRLQAGLAVAAIAVALLVSPGSRRAIAQETGGLPTLADRVAALEAEFTSLSNTVQNIHSSPFTVSGTDVILSGYNLHIVSGSGSTDDGGTPTGLGNLIIGYDAPGNILGSGDVRTGSHNLILGDQNNYSSYGAIVAGTNNQATAPYASVSGGRFNTASGNYSSVSGGGSSTASGDYSSVSGGSGGQASGHASSVNGGQAPVASGDFSTVIGGELNTASGVLATVFGGVENQSSGEWAAVFGGQANSATGLVSSASGGDGITEGATWGWAAGGSGAGAFHNP